MELKVNVNCDDGTCSLEVVGEVDVSNADKLRDELTTLIEGKSKTVVLDLSKVPYIDSTGIGVLMGASRKATDLGITLQACGLQKNVMRIFEMLGVGEVLEVSPEC